MFKTLRSKISLVYIGLVALIAIVGATGFANLYRQQEMIDNLMTANYKSISALSNMLDDMERQDNAVIVYMSVDKQRGAQLFTDNYNDFIKWFTVEKGNITEPNENNLVQQLDADYKLYVESFSQLEKTGAKPAGDVLSEKIKTEVRDLTSINETAMFRSKDEASSSARKSMYFLIVLSVAAVIVGFAASRHFTNQFLQPLYELAKGISRVKAGELGQQLEVREGDETGLLAGEFNRMTKRLTEYEQSTLGELMDEKNRSLAIVKSISDPLLVLDMDYKIVLMNNASESFFDTSESKAAGKHMLETIRNGEIFDLISNTVESNEEHREKILRIKKGEDFYFNVVVTTIRDIESHNTGIILVMQNVTELKELEQVKTDFVATISHEFKTPLTSIIMGVGMLDEGKLGALTEEQHEVVEALREDGERLSNLVIELLELSKIESGRAVYDMKPCSVYSIVENSLRGFLDYAEKKGVCLTDELKDGLPFVMADFEKITWVLNNLVGNALKYTDAGDFITVSAISDKDKVSILVKDTGAGIPQQFLDRIFDRFVRVDGRDIEVRGTGLGLSVAKDIINAHKGDIHVKSGLDAGSVFTFTLPVAAASPGPAGGTL